VSYSRIVSTATLLLVGAVQAFAQSRVPVPPPSSDTVRRVLSSLATGIDAEPILRRLHDQGAPFELLKVDSVGRHAFAKLRSARTGRTMLLDIASDRENPLRIGSIDVLESHASVLDELTWVSPSANDSATASVIAVNMKRLADAGAFSGVVHVLKNDKPLFSRAYGFANVEDSVPMSLRSRFSLASMSKMFTATALLQLVDAGKLRLDDTLARVLPRYPNVDRARQVTIRQLLEHSAGLGDMWNTPKKPVAGLTGALALAAEVSHAPLLFTPGTRWSYSNEGYAVLAAVVEELSGESFHAYLKGHIFAPAGMTETSLVSGSDDIIPHRAVGYRPAADDPLGVGQPRANWSFIRGSTMGGAGGGYSTAGDLERFGRALRDGRLISATSRAEMWSGKWDVAGHAGERYGLGSFVSQLGGKTVAGHGGGGTGSGMDSGFRQFTDGSYTVVVLTNIDPPAGTMLTSQIVRFLASQPAKALGTLNK
jgi:D-alanyl-D-alanine carboxypeptidase